MKTMLNLILVLALIYGGICVFFYLSQRQMLFYPVNAHLQSPAPNWRYQSDGLSLHGWIVAGGNSKGPVVIYFGGNAEDVSLQILEADRYQASQLVLLPYRGYGGNPGRPGEQEIFRDMQIALSQLQQELDINMDQVVLMGRSLGTGVATELASRFQVRGVILISPYDSISSVGQFHYPWLPIRWLNHQRFDSAAKAPGINTPMLAIAAEYDQIVPIQLSERLNTLWGGQTTFIRVPDRTHNDIDTASVYWDEVNRFLRNLTPPDLQAASNG